MACYHVGHAYKTRGDTDGALRELDRTRAAAREIGNVMLEAQVLVADNATGCRATTPRLPQPPPRSIAGHRVAGGPLTWKQDTCHGTTGPTRKIPCDVAHIVDCERCQPEQQRRWSGTAEPSIFQRLPREQPLEHAPSPRTILASSPTGLCQRFTQRPLYPNRRSGRSGQDRGTPEAGTPA